MNKKKSAYRIAVVGATGAVGRTLLQILEERKFPISDLSLFCSPRSAGKTIRFCNEEKGLRELNTPDQLHGFDIAFFTAGSAVSETYVPVAARAGALVIDNSSFFRMHSDVPLVIPEVNPEAIDFARESRIVANPNCTTMQMLVVLKPLHDKFKLKRVVLSSYQAVSGRGQVGVDELKMQVETYSKGSVKPKAFPHAIAFNCIPHIDKFSDNNFTGEEHKVMNETRKILGEPDLRVVATCVRVPVFNAHSESVYIETEHPVTPEQARALLKESPGIQVVDDPNTNLYPLAEMASGRDEVFVGRIRKDLSLLPGENGLALWIVADNLRKGAALNAVQLAELAHERRMIKN